jgi:ABC-type oligopeptide transport system substrate-binding subunit
MAAGFLRFAAGRRERRYFGRRAMEGQAVVERQEEARKLLAEAGFGPNNRLKITYNYINSPDARRSSVAMQDMWKQVGIDADIVAKEFAVHYDLLKTANFQLAFGGWVYDYNDAQSVLFLFKSTTEALNYPGHKSPVMTTCMRRRRRKTAPFAANFWAKRRAFVNDVAVAPNYFLHPSPRESYVLNWKEESAWDKSHPLARSRFDLVRPAQASVRTAAQPRARRLLALARILVQRRGMVKMVELLIGAFTRS